MFEQLLPFQSGGAQGQWGDQCRGTRPLRQQAGGAFWMGARVDLPAVILEETLQGVEVLTTMVEQRHRAGCRASAVRGGNHGFSGRLARDF